MVIGRGNNIANR